MAFLGRDQLLAKQELTIEKVSLGGDDYTFVRQMTGRERDQFEKSLLVEHEDRKGNITFKRVLDDFRAKLAVCTVCDEAGEAVFQPNDYTTLSRNIGAAKLELIVNAAQRLNAISQADQEALVKNSQSGQSAETISASAAS